MYESSKTRVKQVYANRDSRRRNGDRADSAMTTPTVTELPRRREPVSADTFLGELAVAEQRLYGDRQTAFIVLGALPVPLSCQLELFGLGSGLARGCF